MARLFHDGTVSGGRDCWTFKLEQARMIILRKNALQLQ